MSRASSTKCAGAGTQSVRPLCSRIVVVVVGPCGLAFGGDGAGKRGSLALSLSLCLQVT